MADDLAPPIKIPQPRPAIPGMMNRFFAFLIDMVLLYFLGYTLNTVAREPLMRLGHALPLLGSVIGFLYFWLADSPLGGGVTAGKAILNMVVARPNGDPLSYGAAFRRTLLKFPWTLPALFEFAARTAGAPVAVDFYTHSLLLILCQIVVFMLGYMVVTDPFRRGWHDIIAGSYVTGSPVPDEFIRRVNSPTEAELVRSETTRKMSFALVALVGLLMIGTWSIGLFKRDLKRELAARQAIVDANALPGFYPQTIDLPGHGDEESFLREVDRRRRATPAGADVPTTETLRRKLISDGHTAMIQLASVASDLTKERADSPEMKAQLEALRAAWPAILAKAGPEPPQAAPKVKDGAAVAPAAPREPVRIDALAVALYSIFDFFLLPQRSTHVLFARIPVNDAAAPIELQWIDIEAEQKRLKDEAAAQRAAAGTPTPGGGAGAAVTATPQSAR